MRNEEKPSKNLSGNAEEFADFGGLSPSNINCDSFWGSEFSYHIQIFSFYRTQFVG